MSAFVPGAVPRAGGMRLVWRLGAATTVTVLAFSMTAPVLAVLLQRQGHGTAAIGAFSMLPFLLVGLLIPVTPRWLAHVGLLRGYRWGIGLELAGAVAMATGDGIWHWAAASIVYGIGAAAVWNATEAMLAREAPPERRGRVMGLYQTSMGAALALGPLLPALVGLQARGMLWLAAGLLASGLAMVLGARLPPEHEGMGARPTSMLAALRRVPALAAIAFAGGIFEAGLGSVGAAHASSTGLPLGTAATVAGAIGVGSFLCQYPAGLASDRYTPRRTFIVALCLLLAASLCLLGAGRWPALLWAVGAVWGGVGGALYTLTMVQVAHRFPAQALAGGTAAMITGYTAGGVAGPVASGSALAAGGLPALSVLLVLVAAGALVAARRME